MIGLVLKSLTFQCSFSQGNIRIQSQEANSGAKDSRTEIIVVIKNYVFNFSFLENSINRSTTIEIKL